jgi:hypothetical protein
VAISGRLLREEDRWALAEVVVTPTLVPASWRRLPDLSTRGCVRRTSPARDIPLDEPERAELLPVMDAAVAAARLTSEVRSLQMA